MGIVYIIFLVTVASITYYGLSKKKRNTLKNRNQVLIELFLRISKHMKIEDNSKNEVHLVWTSIRGTIRVSLSRYGGIIFISIQKGVHDFKSKRKDWIFLEVMDQHLIFNEVIADLHKISVDWNLGKEEHILSLLNESNKSIACVKLKNIFFNCNRVAAAYCLAYQSLNTIKKKQSLDDAESFEVLFFLCMVTFERLKRKNKSNLMSMLVNYLLYFLEIRNLLVEVKDVSKLVNHRIGMYTEQVHIIKSGFNYSFGVLCYYFFVKPLGHKAESPLEIGLQNDFSEILMPIFIELENKLSILEDQIKKNG